MHLAIGLISLLLHFWDVGGINNKCDDILAKDG
jgi:hypothetical protein